MIDTLIRTLKGMLPDESWDFIYETFEPHQVKFDKPPYEAVRVSPTYMLVRVKQQNDTTNHI